MNKGNSVNNCLPKFFKVYLPDDSGDDLEIPISFNSFLPKYLPKTVIVKSIYGNVWRLQWRKCCGEVEKFVMVNGWKRIVEDEDLSGGEFLAFEFDGSRLFNFCIYGHTTCKRLKSLVQTKEMRPDSVGGDGRSNDVLDVDDDDGTGSHDVHDNGDSEKSSEDIIVLDDGDGDVNDVQDNGDGDGSSEDVIVLDDDSDGHSSEGDYDSSVDSKRSDNEDDRHRQYLDNDMNPFFIVNHNTQRKTNLPVPARLIKHYDLRFPECIYVIDPLVKRFGKLTRKVEDCTIQGFESILRRNRVKPNDKMICELEKEMNGLVCGIKIHIISGEY